jgi:hypothetical protein
LDKSECGEGGLFEGMKLSVQGDALAEDKFEETLEEARELATSNGARMRSGDIRRDPLGGICSEYCTFQPICRLERALGLEQEENGNGE